MPRVAPVVAALGYAMLLGTICNATRAKRTSMASHCTYADMTVLRPTATYPDTNTRLYSSAKLYELVFTVPADDINPDQISDNSASMPVILLQEADKRGVALDWGSYRFHINDSAAGGAAEFIARVDVLQ